MPRKRKADAETALSAAQDVFWRSGYTRAGTREIEDETGITRFTLQTSYGGKEGLFLDTLDAYLDRAEAKHFPNPDAFDGEALAVWFEQLTSNEKMPLIEHSGCLAFNSIGGFDRENDKINQRIRRYLGGLDERIKRILERASAQGQLVSNQTPESLARILVTQLLGLHVIIKARVDDDYPKEFGKSCSALIRSWLRAEQVQT